MTLIHSALKCEAQAIIERYKLEKISFNLYKNKNILVAISGVGKEKTRACLKDVLNAYNVTKVINVGIAGCSDKSVDIGELFCVDGSIKGIKSATITCVEKPVKTVDTLLVDMESDAFILACEEKGIEHICLKVVSDYLNDTDFTKDFVKKLIRESIKKWEWII